MLSITPIFTFKENEAKNVRPLIQGHTCSSWQLGFKKLLIFIGDLSLMFLIT